jgi:hypothetical protein
LGGGKGGGVSVLILPLKGKFGANERGVKKMENGTQSTGITAHFIFETLKMLLKEQQHIFAIMFTCFLPSCLAIFHLATWLNRGLLFHCATEYISLDAYKMMSLNCNINGTIRQ